MSDPYESQLWPNEFAGANAGEEENVSRKAAEFFMGLGEMMVGFGRACRDIVKQSVLKEDFYVVRKLGGPCSKACERLSFLNEYLPEDRDPVHAWSVILSVFFVALAALTFNARDDTYTPLKKVCTHPPNASRILLPDGRYLAYQEQGVPAERARFSMIALHSFLSSRLAGIPGIKTSLLEEFGIRLVTYDLPGFGESEPHPDRDLLSSAMDMSYLANAVGIQDKFWVVGFSGGSIHAWAAIRYIPDRLAGAAVFSPMVNPYEPRMTKEEKYRIWNKWPAKRKLMFFLARRFPRFLAYFYHQSFLCGMHGQIERWLSLSLGKRDRALVQKPMFEGFWQRDVEESIRQGIAKPFVEEAVLQVSNWGFSLADLRMLKKRQGKDVLHWLKSLYNQEEELTGFLGPIHVWQGMDDRVSPPSMADFVQRVVPGAMVHKISKEGHFTYFYFCDECHRNIFTTLFGTPEGPLNNTAEVEQTLAEADAEDKEKVTFGDTVPN
ncbi:uncharacterized protein LOC131149842 isoform X1 [Malania oleifera]|uniref:uncharacterized protein LOC131149842 isoform X1 n=1 Tax=Malania oleifera TaxID=397392 RepID=UPI0025ADADC8|nr:uncharacterized protein LOC131149842 isoform X1 [Malania oleifera]